MATLLEAVTGYALACVLGAMLLCTWRLLKGPSAHDRVLALDTLWMCGMLLALSGVMTIEAGPIFGYLGRASAGIHRPADYIGRVLGQPAVPSPSSAPAGTEAPR